MPIRKSLAKIKGRIFNRGKNVEWFYSKVLRKAIVLKSKDGFLFEFQPENSFARHINRNRFTDDKSVLEYIKRNVKQGDTCFDIGACFGVVTLCMAQSAGETGQVFSFEAEKKNFLNLRRNLELNHFKNTKAFNKGVYSNENGFELSVFSKEAYGIHAVKNAYEKGEHIQKVETICLDNFCTLEGIGQIDLIKIDVEGVEPEILKGSIRLLRSHAIKKIIFEVSELSLNKYGYTIEKLTGLLTENDYSIWEINEDGSLTGPMQVYPKTNFANWVALAPGIN